MSQRKIRQVLKRKGISIIDAYYERDAVVPEGYACGWSLEFSEDCVEEIFNIDDSNDIEEFMDFDTIAEVLLFLDTLPNLRNEK
tara:strand:- start:350 stop:601 length:252 start_codon:yes stop_codon:yes gene_type:complete